MVTKRQFKTVQDALDEAICRVVAVLEINTGEHYVSQDVVNFSNALATLLDRWIVIAEIPRRPEAEIR